MRNISLTSRMLISYILIGVISLVLALAVVFFYYYNNLDNQFNRELELYKSTLVNALGEAPDRLPTTSHLGNAKFGQLASGWYWQIFSLKQNKIIYRSPSLGADSLPVFKADNSKALLSGRLFRYLDYPEGNSLKLMQEPIYSSFGGVYIVTIAVSRAGLRAQMSDLIVASLVVIGFSFLWFMTAAIIFVNYAIKPLRRMVRDIDDIKVGTRDRVADNYPSEIRTIAEQINNLLAAYRTIIERTRNHVSNLAHSLKTPLSVINNELEDGDNKTIATIKVQAKAMQNQIDHYLQRAQIVGTLPIAGIRIEVIPVIKRLCRTMTKIYDKQINFVANVPAQVEISGDVQDIEEIFGNLLDNACKWANSKVAITVNYGHKPQTIDILVKDDGSGLNASDQRVIVTRGYRLDQSVDGSGLGLAIVSELVSLYDGELNIIAAEDEYTGLNVKITLPYAKPHT